MKKTVIAAIIVIFLIAFIPLFALKDAEFGGSDDAGSVVVEEVDSSYEPWATPIFEKLLGRELPGEVESLLFGKAALEGMPSLAELYQGEIVPSRAFVEGGIHEAIMEYENNVFFDILAEDLARRDMEDAPIDESNYDELASRIDAYIAEFEQHGTDHILVDLDTP